MAYDETDVYQDGADGSELAYEAVDDVVSYDGASEPAYGDAEADLGQNEGVSYDSEATNLEELPYDSTATESVVDPSSAYYTQDQYDGEGFQEGAGGYVASVADLLADGELLNEYPEASYDDSDASVPSPAESDVTGVTNDPSTETYGWSSAGAEEAVGSADLQDDLTADDEKIFSQSYGVGPAAPEGYQVDPSVELLPNTQVIQPVTNVSSMANTTYDEDADSKAAVAALEARRKKRRRQRTLKIVLVLVIGIGLAAAFILTRGLRNTNAAAVREAPATIAVMREDFVSSVTSQGSLKPADATIVTPEVEGTLQNMLVSEGSVVAEGDVLFVIKSEALEKALSDANAQLTSANNNLSTRDAAVQTAYNNYNRGVDAYNAGDILVDISSLRAEVTAAEEMRTAANDAVTSARQAVANAQAAVDKCTVKSPRSGTVVAINNQPTANNPISVEVADISQMKVTVQVNEMDISLVSVGQEATFSFSALPDVHLTGRVDSIASMATSAGGTTEASSYGSGVVTFGVTLIIPLPDPQLKPGMTATATILTENVPDALVLPLTAVSIDPDDTSVGTVNVVTDLTTYATQSRSVTIGPRSSTEAVITGGLEEGEVVTLSELGIVSDSIDTTMMTE